MHPSERTKTATVTVDATLPRDWNGLRDSDIFRKQHDSYDFMPQDSAAKKRSTDNQNTDLNDRRKRKSDKQTKESGTMVARVAQSSITVIEGFPEGTTLHSEGDSSADWKKLTDTQEIDLNDSRSRKIDKRTKESGSTVACLAHSSITVDEDLPEGTTFRAKPGTSADKKRLTDHKAGKRGQAITPPVRGPAKTCKRKSNPNRIRGRCTICNAAFKSRSLLSKHLVCFHSDADRSLWPYPCRFCSDRLLTFAQLRGHERAFHPAEYRSYLCQGCGKGYADWSGLERHLISVHGASEKRLPCGACGRRYRNRSMLRSHRCRPRLKAQRSCPFCRRTFRSHLYVHVLQHLGVRQCVCPICRHTYQKIGLDIHMRYHHPESLNPELQREGGVYMTPHTTPPSQGPQHECPVCHQIFHQKASLDGHPQYRHPESLPPSKVLSPDLVGESGVSMESATAASQGRQYDYPICRQTFYQKASLDKHMQCHHSESPQLDPEHSNHTDDSSGNQDPDEIKKGEGATISHSQESSATGTQELDPKECRCEHWLNGKPECRSHRVVERMAGTLMEYACPVCSSCFPSYSSLDRHRRQAGHAVGMLFYVCDLCEDRFRTAFRLLVHRLRHHLEVPPFRCCRCDRKFHTQRRTNSHVLRHAGVPKFRCIYCDEVYYSPNLLRVHMLRHVVRNPLELTNHRDRLRAEDGNIHWKSSMPPDKHPWLHAEDENIHRKSSMLPEELPQLCPKNDNVRRKSPSPPCAENGKVRRKSPPPPEKPAPLHICRSCGLQCRSPEALRVHSDDQHALRYYCDQCGKHFSSVGNLRRHRLIHSGTRKFCCEVCGRRFTQSNSLAEHQRLHTGVRPYQCATCGRGFAQKSNLKSHMKKHLS